MSSSTESLVEDRSHRFASADHRSLLLLALGVLLLAVAGVMVSRVVGKDLLRRDGQDMTTSWADSVTRNCSDIPAIVAGARPSAGTTQFLKDASRVGDVYRYKIWNKAGQQILDSNPAAPSTPPAFSDSVTSVVRLADSNSGRSDGNPAQFTVSTIPIKQNGAIVGFFEVYLDETADYALYEGSLHITEIILAIAVLLAGGLPSFMVRRTMLAHRKSQAETLFLAEHDSLTGVANRNRLKEAARSALAWTSRNQSYVAALLIDLDRFKEINDSLGHGAGDQLLIAFAARLNSTIRQEDMLARIGGDEFVILQVGMAQPEGAGVLTDRLTKVLAEPYEIGGLRVTCGASIGVAIAPDDAEEWDPLLSCADAALYKAKAEGRDAVCFFETGMDEDHRERRRLELKLRQALETKAFQIAYQPLVNIRDGSLVGFEALLRWPEGWDPQTPAAFIPVAEAYGLIVPIGAWVLETACKTAATWTKPLKVAVNLSSVQFRHGDIVATVESALKTSGLDPARLELEVTESLWLQNTEAVHSKLMRLRGMGVSIVLDDFGTGYSSLTYLWKFPFDMVKIDRSFVMGMELDLKAAAIVNTIVALSKSLAITVTAEGVETPAQARALNAVGCDQAQGYLFSRPLSVSAAWELANAQPAPSPQSMDAKRNSHST